METVLWRPSHQHITCRLHSPTRLPACLQFSLWRSQRHNVKPHIEGCSIVTHATGTTAADGWTRWKWNEWKMSHLQMNGEEYRWLIMGFHFNAVESNICRGLGETNGQLFYASITDCTTWTGNQKIHAFERGKITVDSRLWDRLESILSQDDFELQKQVTNDLKRTSIHTKNRLENHSNVISTSKHHSGFFCTVFTEIIV